MISTTESKNFALLRECGFTETKVYGRDGFRPYYSGISKHGRFTAFVLIGKAWHGFDSEGSWSGYRPDSIGGLGDVIGTEGQLKTFRKRCEEAPEKFFQLTCIGQSL